MDLGLSRAEKAIVVAKQAASQIGVMITLVSNNDDQDDEDDDEDDGDGEGVGGGNGGRGLQQKDWVMIHLFEQT